MWSKELPIEAHRRETHAALALLAALLRAASRSLDALAARIAATRRSAVIADPVVEFHGEAGAPEGALYVDGQLVGRVLGVNRL